MKMVIDIDKKAFDYIKACSFVEDEAVMLNQSLEDRIKTLMFFDVLNAIKNGTPLPKGHGKIIDVTDLLDRIGLDDTEENRKDNVGEIVTLEDIDFIPAIIEADKEANDG